MLCCVVMYGSWGEGVLCCVGGRVRVCAVWRGVLCDGVKV